MKKAFCTGTLAVSLLLGAARAADLFLNTDTATGFLLSGSVWTRYWPSVTGGAEADGAGAVPEPLSSFFPDGKNSAASGRI